MPHIPTQGVFEDDVPFPKMGYLSFLEGRLVRASQKSKHIQTIESTRVDTVYFTPLPYAAKNWCKISRTRSAERDIKPNQPTFFRNVKKKSAQVPRRPAKESPNHEYK